MKKLWEGIRWCANTAWSYISSTVKFSWTTFRVGMFSCWENMKNDWAWIKITWNENKFRAIMGTITKIIPWVLSPLAVVVWTLLILIGGLVVVPFALLIGLGVLLLTFGLVVAIPLLIWPFEWLSDKILGVEGETNIRATMTGVMDTATV